MAKIGPFEKYTGRYDNWFERNYSAWKSELNGIKKHLPEKKKGIEIGVGSGRFAEPLNIRFGIEPSRKMGKIAKDRDIVIINGIAEKLPIKTSVFDFALMVTTICFLDDIALSFREIYRILKPDGKFIIGFIDRNSPVGKIYENHKFENVFYKEATFYTVMDVVTYLKKAGFEKFFYSQTIFNNLSEIKNIEPVKDGFGEGSFVIIRAE
ncbi:SAM-dependent methyltransferase, partial [candidate division KSB1 bacterium]